MEKNTIKSTLELDDKLILSPDASLRIVNGEYLYYNRETETVFSTTQTGHEILTLCDGRTIKSIIDFMSRKYSTSFEMVYNDTIEFLKECIKNHILIKILSGYYTSTSIFYELARGNYKKDIKFYYKLKNFIKQRPKKILDLGGGSARLLFALSKIFQNSDLFCIDNSWQMIAIGEIKRRMLNFFDSNYLNCSKRIHLIHEDITNLKSVDDEEFDLVLFGYHSFDHILDEEDQIKVLKETFRILKNKGVLILNVLNRDMQPPINIWQFEGILKFGNLFLEIWSFFKKSLPDRHEVIWCWKLKNDRGALLEYICSSFTRKDINIVKLRKVLRDIGFKIYRTEIKGKEIYIIAIK